MRKICIGIPHTGTFPWQTLASIIGLKIPAETQIKYHLVGSCLVYEARESIVRFAIENKSDYILFMDSDMVLPPDTLIKMIKVLETTDYKMVTGTIFKRTEPFQPCFYTRLAYDKEKFKPYLDSPVEFPSEGLIPLQGMGMACCLIDTKILNELKAPYFFPLPNLGEDLTFCLKLRQKEVKMCVDLSIDVGHVASMPIQQIHFRACYDEYKRLNTGKPIFATEDNNDSK